MSFTNARGGKECTGGVTEICARCGERWGIHHGRSEDDCPDQVPEWSHGGLEKREDLTGAYARAKAFVESRECIPWRDGLLRVRRVMVDGGGL